MEGKDRPDDLGKKSYEERGGKTVGLLLRMTEGIWNSGRVIILDSGFCILRGIVELSKVGLFALALIKKGGTGPNISRATPSERTLMIEMLAQWMRGQEQWTGSGSMCSP